MKWSAEADYNPRNLAKPAGGTWRTYRRLLGYAWHYKFRLIISLMLAVIVAASFGTMIFSIGTVVTVIFGDQEEVTARIERVAANLDDTTARLRSLRLWAPQQLGDRLRTWIHEVRTQDRMKMHALVGLAIVLTSMTAVCGLARFLHEYLAGTVGANVSVRLGRDMFDNVMGLSIRFFEQRSTGEILARFTNDIFMVNRGLVGVFVTLMQEPVKALVFLGMALWVDVPLTLVGLCVMPPAVYVIWQIGKKVKKSVRRSLEKIASMATVAAETFSGIVIVKGFCMEAYESARTHGEFRKLRKHLMKLVRADAATQPLTEFILTVGLAVFVLLSGRKVISGPMQGGDLVLLYFYLAATLDPVRKLAKVNNLVQQSVASAERVFEFIDLQPDIAEAPDAVDLPPLKESLRFEDVHFSYDGAREVLKGLKIEVKKGEMVALVGFSGAGKSTLVKLIPRFYEVSRGAITIDGTDIRRATFQSLRRQISIVTQETILFNESVRDNIAFGQPDFTHERVRAAARAAHASDFIEKLPHGYQTAIGESGVTLSGGQRQRLAIARAIIKDPAILILDEATSSLDSESERAIQEAIEQFVVGRTTLVIAHRLSTVQRADRIVVLDEGCIVEQGTHRELLELGGLYKRLYDVQFAPAEPKPAT